MLKQIWQHSIRLFHRVFGFAKQPPPQVEPEPPSNLASLSDSEFEHYFLQLLDGVNKGWEQVKVGRFFAALSDRATEEQWIAWLWRFRRNLLASAVPNAELGRRLVRLGELNYGQISEIALDIGTELLGRLPESDRIGVAEPTTAAPSPSPETTPPAGEEPAVTPSPDLEDFAPNLDAESTQLPLAESVSQFTPVAPHSESDNAPPIAAPIAPGETAAEAEDAESWCDRAVERMEAGDYNEAITALDRAIALNPNHHRAWINRGNAAIELGQLEAAVSAYDRALAIEPQAHLAWLHRGDALYDLERIEEALASWDKALDINPKDAETWYNKGLALGIKLAQWEEALACWEKALEINPKDAQTWFHHGVGLAALDRLEEALVSWNNATEIKPDFRDAWINQGVVLQKMGRYAEAIEANNRAIGLFSG